MAFAEADLQKLVRMLKKTVKHEGTHLLLTCIAVYLAGKRAAKLAVRHKVTKSLVQTAAASVEGLEVEQSPLQADVIHDSQTHGTGRSASEDVRGSHSMPRAASAESLSDRVLAPRSLCTGCMSRARSMVDLRAYEHSAGEQQSERRRVTFKAGPYNDCVCATDPPAAGTGATDVDGSFPQLAGCRVGGCIACAGAAETWSRLVRRALAGGGVAFLGYLLWLRFVARPETALRQLLRGVRLLAALFRYRVAHAERLPTQGGALITVYHGFVPLDMYFLHEWLHRHTGKLPCTLAADFVFRIPFLGWAARLGGAAPAGRAAALEALREGRMVVVAPGGVREAMGATTADYVVDWFGRTGFAEVAQTAQVPIVPLFTRNVRELFLVLGANNPLVTWLYNLTKLPFTPFLGPVPLPLTSALGPQLPFDAAKSAADVANEAEEAMRGLIRTVLAQ